jgi:aspartate-semialdehyde dehydrogenase
VRVVLVGATGAVGSEMLSILEEREFPVEELVPVASPRSAGRRLAFRGEEVEVVSLSPEAFESADIAIFDVPDEIAAEWAPVATERGAVVVDNSAAFRLDRDVPLVVPEINPGAVEKRPKGIIASPNCTALTVVVPLAPLHRQAGLSRLVLASYQSVSGAGRPGVDDLWEQTQVAVKDAEAVTAGRADDILEPGGAFPHPIALNVIPQVGSVKDGGYTSEEVKLGEETRKIMDLPELPVTATCVRVPVVVGHGVAIHAEFREPLSPGDARAILSGAPGVEVMDDPGAGIYPTPLKAAGRDPCYVGRIRRDASDPTALAFFSVADNLRKGAALNAVQVAELLV